MERNNLKSLLTLFLKIAFVILAIVLLSSSIKFFIEFNTISITSKFNKIVIGFIILGYEIIIKVLLQISHSIKNNQFTKSSIKKFNILGYIFFIGAIIEAFYSSLFNTSQCIIKIIVVNITMNLITLSILSLTFFVLADLFNKMIDIKEENDLTV